MPCADVKISPAGIVPTSVLIRARLAKVRRHHVKRGIAHGETESYVSNHRRNKIAVVALSRPSISWSIGLSIQRCGHGHDAFLPRGPKALAAETTTIRRFHTFGENILEGSIQTSCPGHQALPFKPLLNGHRHVVGQTTKHQTHVHQKVGPTPLKHDLHAATRNDFSLEFATKRAFHLLLEATLKSVDKPSCKRVPRGPFEGFGLSVDHVVPYIGHEEEVSIVSLSNEGEDFRAGGVFGEGLDKFQRLVGSPIMAKDFRKVSLRHGLSPTLARDGWFQSSSHSG